jgi:hypothetical protein
MTVMAITVTRIEFSNWQYKISNSYVNKSNVEGDDYPYNDNI